MSIGELFAGPARQAAAGRETAHRPWPLPDSPWVAAQTWEGLCFAHWRVPYEALRPLVPGELELDRFDGSAWLGVSAFRIAGFRARGMLPLPGLSSFPELNVRTYVTAGGKPGIWFFSLDTTSPVLAEGGRRVYRLPYFRARIRVERRGGEISVSSARSDAAGAPVVFSAAYAPAGPAAPPARGSREHFLAERYCLYAADGPRLYRAEIHHPPWPLQPARGRIELNTMAPQGVELPDEEPVLHYAERQDVLIWAPARI